jgi:hypothetical protein
MHSSMSKQDSSPATLTTDSSHVAVLSVRQGSAGPIRKLKFSLGNDAAGMLQLAEGARNLFRLDATTPLENIALSYVDEDGETVTLYVSCGSSPNLVLDADPSRYLFVFTGPPWKS